jgi:mRNA-degrading endonuclease toxin of MazEF toxin-antitoxin module
MLAVPRALLDILHLQPQRAEVAPPLGGSKASQSAAANYSNETRRNLAAERPAGSDRLAEAFQPHHESPHSIPITSNGNFARAVGFALPLTGSNTTGTVRCDQSRALDLASRRGSKLESVPDAVVNEVLAKPSPIFE